MRVLHVISDRNIGGAGVLLTTLLQHFDNTKIESIVALPHDSQLIGRLESIGVSMRFLYADCDRFHWKSVRELRSIIEQEAIDIVHANAAISARIAGKLSHKIVVHTRHCCFPPSGIWKNRAVCKIGGRINNMLSDRVIATADAAAENLKLLGIPASSIEVIVNGSMPIRAVSDAELNAFLEKYHLQKKDFFIGICARLEECKGHDVFLRAAKLVLEQKNMPKPVFLIIGNGSQRLTLEKMAEELGIAERVKFLGFVEDMALVYRILRLNVNCSRGTETSCLALSEGMSAGVPFVASDFGGNRAMCGESMAGMLFPVDDERALADHICEILTDPSLEAKMREAALKRYQKKYTAEQMSEHLAAVYEELYHAKYEGSGLRQ